MQTITSAMVAVTGLAGLALADNKSLATVPLTCYVLGSAITTIPASLLMKAIGRRAGFQAGTGAGMIGAAVCAAALYVADFWLLIRRHVPHGHLHRVRQVLPVRGRRCRGREFPGQGDIVHARGRASRRDRRPRGGEAFDRRGRGLRAPRHLPVGHRRRHAGAAAPHPARHPDALREGAQGSWPAACRDHAPARLHRRRDGRHVLLRDHEPHDDLDAAGDACPRPPFQRRRVRAAVAHDRDVRAVFLHRLARPALRRGADHTRRHRDQPRLHARGARGDGAHQFLGCDVPARSGLELHVRRRLGAPHRVPYARPSARRRRRRTTS